MDDTRKKEIYDRLLAIHIDVESERLPFPQYINGKIGECHAGIEEVEKFYIQTSREISVIQRVLNDTMARYDYEKENLISNNQGIRDLPNIKDREARANNLLKDTIHEIKQYENENVDLNNLLKTITLKLRNLSRVNTDIKMQLRVMEAQIKLGAYTPGEEAREDIFKGKNVFDDATTRMRHTQIVDPTAPLDVDNLLKPQEQAEPAQAEVPASLVNPADDKEPDPDLMEDAEDSMNQDDSLDEEEPWVPPEVAPVELSAEIISEAEHSKPQEYTLDLDKILDNIHKQDLLKTSPTPDPKPTPSPTPEGGSPAVEKAEIEKAVQASVVQAEQIAPVAQADTKKESQSGIDKLDLDSLLSQFK